MNNSEEGPTNSGLTASQNTKAEIDINNKLPAHYDYRLNNLDPLSMNSKDQEAHAEVVDILNGESEVTTGITSRTVIKTEIIDEDEWKETFLNIASASISDDENADFRTKETSNTVKSAENKEEETYTNILSISCSRDETTFQTKESEILNRTSESEIEYFVGDIVWVIMKGHPLWPGIICYPLNETIFTKFAYKSSSELSGSMQYHIQFFSKDYRTIWAYSTTIFHYDGLNYLAPYIEKLNSKINAQTFVTSAEQNILNSFSKMCSLLTFQAKHRKAMHWYQAVEEADICIALERYERVQIFKELIKRDREKRKISKVNNKKSNRTRKLVIKEEIEIRELQNIDDQSSEDIKNIRSKSHKDVENIQENLKGRDRQSDVKAKFLNSCNSPDELVLFQQLETSEFPKVVLKRLNSKVKKISKVSTKNSSCKLNELVVKEEEIKDQELQDVLDQLSDMNVQGKFDKVAKIIEEKSEERDRQSELKPKFLEGSPEDLVLHKKLETSESSSIGFQRLDTNNQKESFHVVSNNKENEEGIVSTTQSHSSNSAEKSKSFKYFEINVTSDRKDFLQNDSKQFSGFKCAHCEYSCQAKYTMKRHSLTHSLTKRFKCFKCNYETNYKTNLRVHLRIHADAKLFKCADCNYECNQKGSLKFHILTHHKNSYKRSECNFESDLNNECNFKSDLNNECNFESDLNNSQQKHLSKQNCFKCEHCEFSCKTKRSMERHSLTHSGTRLFKCFECDYVTNYKANLQLHLYKHSNLKLFKCSECNYECNQKGSLRLHLLKHFNQKLYKCCACDYKCNLKSTLKLHLLMHGEKKLLKCTECNYETNYKGNLKLHISTHSKTTLLKCSECDYECNLKSSIKQHIKEAHSLFKCSECDYECNQKSNIKQHIKEAHSLFKCSECDYECNQKSNLKQHIKEAHPNKELFECLNCSYKTDHKRQLKRHLSIHSVKKLLKCSECSYTSIRKDNLRIHLLTHSDTLFECSECNFKSKYQYSIKRHLLIHSKLFECSECSYKSISKGNLKSHLLTHSNDYLFECSECAYKSNYKSGLKRHLLKHKKKNFEDKDFKIKTEQHDVDIKVEIDDIKNEIVYDEEADYGDLNDDIENVVSYDRNTEENIFNQ